MVELPYIFTNIIVPKSIATGVNHELFFEFNEDDFGTAIDVLYSNNFSLASLFAVQNYQHNVEFSLLYVFSTLEDIQWLVVVRPVIGNPSSIVIKFPSALWCEREITDGFGINFADSVDTRRLILHEIYNRDFHPLLKSKLTHPITNGSYVDEYEFKNFTGNGMYQVPVGPVHAGIIEPGHFRFSVIGETIYNLEIRMFYKHRGIEKFMEGKTPEHGLRIISKISGDETVGNSVAFCTAIEKISQISPTDKALMLRTILLEMERIYSHLNDIAGMILDVSFAIASSQIFILREELFRWNEKITGSRFMRNSIVVGGVSEEINQKELDAFLEYLSEFMKRFEDATNLAKRATTVIDRFESTGVVKQSLVRPLHLTGPIARASGVKIDTRITHPYGIYSELIKQAQTEKNGDVQSRFNVKVYEVITSAKLIILLVKQLPRKSEDPISFVFKDGHALSAVELSRGENLQFVSIKNGIIDRFKHRSSSYFNWRAIEHAVIGNIVADFPLINKSMNLSYAGTDL